jgi:DNA-directed RNA polymerase sigma subunit (sigma70/sigma32)
VEEARLDDDAVSIYLREACAAPGLTRNEEIELSRHVLARDQHAESAGRRLVEANLPLVVSISQGYRDTAMHVLDLIQYGNQGLLVALKTFSDSSAETFTAHASERIKDAVVQAIAESRRSQR